MRALKQVSIGVISWVLTITGLHLWLNVDWSQLLNDFQPLEKRKLSVAYIPVT